MKTTTWFQMFLFPVILMTVVCFLMSCTESDNDEPDQFALFYYSQSVLQTSDTGYLICGYMKEGNFGQKTVFLLKTDAMGNHEWSRQFFSEYNEYAYSLQPTNDEGFIICGETHKAKSGFGDASLIKIDDQGTVEWSATYGGLFSDSGWSARQTTDNGYILTGVYSIHEMGPGDVFLVKTDAQGNEEWSRSYGGYAYDKGRSILQCVDGGFITCGETRSYGTDSTDVYLLKTDPLGNMEWSTQYGDFESDNGTSIDHTPDGYIICGRTRSYGSGYWDIYLIKTDRLGNEQWFQTFGGNNNDLGNDVKHTDDGGYIVCGSTLSFGIKHDIYVVKTDEQGNAEWSYNYGSDYDDYGNSVQQTVDGGYIICGYTEIQDTTGDCMSAHTILIKLNATGNIEWSQTFGN